MESVLFHSLLPRSCLVVPLRFFYVRFVSILTIINYDVISIHFSDFDKRYWFISRNGAIEIKMIIIISSSIIIIITPDKLNGLNANRFRNGAVVVVRKLPSITLSAGARF